MMSSSGRNDGWWNDNLMELKGTSISLYCVWWCMCCHSISITTSSMSYCQSCWYSFPKLPIHFSNHPFSVLKTICTTTPPPHHNLFLLFRPFFVHSLISCYPYSHSFFCFTITIRKFEIWKKRKIQIKNHEWIWIMYVVLWLLYVVCLSCVCRLSEGKSHLIPS
jgi:hypothetical protein